jgi:phosphatidate phosphatase PAH1
MMTLKQLEELQKAGKIRGFQDNKSVSSKKAGKYGNQKTILDGIVFDSAKEARRYMELRTRLAVGEIDKLQLQVEFVLEVNGGKVASYVADFVYQENGKMVVEDVKSAVTRRIRIYRLKKKLMKQIHGIDIIEK